MKNRRTYSCRRVILVFLGLSLAGCAALTGNTQDNRIEGSVWYKERMLLPPGANVEVSLEDISKADAPATVIASTDFRAEKSPPWDFVLTYDPDLIKDRNRYGLRAKITRDDQLLFVSTEANLVFPNSDDGNKRILVSRVGSAFEDDKQTSPEPTTDLPGTYWELVTIGGEKIDPDAVRKPLNIVFVKEEQRVHGYAGCNSFNGGYQQTEDRLQFETLASTMMACSSGMDREQRFMKALDNTQRQQISDGELTLFNANGDPLLRFKAGETL